MTQIDHGWKIALQLLRESKRRRIYETCERGHFEVTYSAEYPDLNITASEIHDLLSRGLIAMEFPGVYILASSRTSKAEQ